MRKCDDFEFVNTEIRPREHVSSARLYRTILYTEDIVDLSLRPKYPASTILAVNKTRMYVFHYRYAITKYVSRVKLLRPTRTFYGTLYKYRTYADIKADLNVFHASVYSRNHLSHSDANKNVVDVVME